MLNTIKTQDKIIVNIKTIKSLSVVNDLIKFYNNTSKSDIKNIDLDFSRLNSRVFPPALVSIAGISDYYKEKNLLNINYITAKKDYFSHTNVDNPVPVASNDGSKIESIFDRVISFSTSNDVYWITNSIMNYLKTKIECNSGVLIGLSWCMNEIMDNVFWHSKEKKGYFAAQIHKESKLISISIYDNGIGILNSFNASNNFNLLTDYESICQAIKKGVTCNPEIGQGNGLWGLNEIVKEAKGFLTIKTGKSKIVFDYEKGKEEISNRNAYLDNYNRGTRVDFTIKLNRLIDINKALDNYAPYEKISEEIEDSIDKNGYYNYNVFDVTGGSTGIRSTGELARIELLNIIKIDSSPVLIDFERVETISSSFADEFIGKLVNSIGMVEFANRFKIINANDFNKGLINKAIAERITRK